MILLSPFKRLYKALLLLLLIPLLGNVSPGNPEKISVDRKPVHIMFLFVDHYEPNKNENFQEIIARPWVDSYSRIADKHRDSDGFPPRHTWFFLYFGKKWKQDPSILQIGTGEIKILDEKPSLFYRISRENLKRKRPFILF